MGRGRGNPVPRSLAQPAWVFLPEESVPTAAASSAPPPPKPLRGRGPVVPTRAQQCQASQAGSGPGPGPRHLGTRTAASKALDPSRPYLQVVHMTQGRRRWGPGMKRRGFLPPPIHPSINTDTKRRGRERSDKGAWKTDWSQGGGDSLRDGVLTARSDTQSARPQEPSPNTLGARTWGQGGVLRAIKEGPLLARPRETEG